MIARTVVVTGDDLIGLLVIVLLALVIIAVIRRI